MSENSAIEWTDHTFNPWWGCTKVSEGCEHCYAEAWAKRTGHSVWGKQSDRRFFGDKHWAEPLKWNREAEKAGVRRRVFCASMADVFENRPDLDSQRARLGNLIRSTPALDWLLLTKRPHNMVEMGVRDFCFDPEAWPGEIVAMTTAEDQARFDERVPELLAVPAARHGISYEPALGPLDISRHASEIDWLIAGAESGHGARPMVEQWIRDVRDQCIAAGVRFFYKQKLDGRGHKVSLPMLDGRQWAETP